MRETSMRWKNEFIFYKSLTILYAKGYHSNDKSFILDYQDFCYIDE